jgi:hypothetical protein
MRSFTISTARIGLRRWCWVRIHPTVEHLRLAAHRTRPQHGLGWWDECCGCFHPTTHDTHEATGEKRYPRNGFAGTLRLAEGWVTSEIVAHELVHAAAQVYRMNVNSDVRFGKGCHAREEGFAYIYGELYASFETAYHGS